MSFSSRLGLHERPSPEQVMAYRLQEAAEVILFMNADVLSPHSLEERRALLEFKAINKIRKLVGTSISDKKAVAQKNKITARRAATPGPGLPLQPNLRKRSNSKKPTTNSKSHQN